MAKELFDTKEVAEAYAKYRLNYGQDVYDAILAFCKESPSCNFSLAVDVGCASGQSTLPLAEHFLRVIGVDESKENLAQAPNDIPNVTFRLGSAEDLSFLENNSVDLVTVAQAIHYINEEVFYKEAERILKPGGSLVIYGHGHPAPSTTQDEIVSKFLSDHLRSYFEVESIKRNKEFYRDYTLPFPGWRRNDSLSMEVHWTVDGFAGFLFASTVWQAYLQDHPNSTLAEDMKKICNEAYQVKSPSERPVRCILPIFMLMGHKPT